MTVNATAALVSVASLVGCTGPMRPVPREGMNDVREYLVVHTRAPSADETVSADPQRVWRTDAGRGTLGAPAMGERITALATVDRYIVALDTRNGQMFWRFRADQPFGAGPVMGNGRVFAATEGMYGMLYAINVHSGKRAWRTRVGDVAGPLALHDSLVYGTTQLGGQTFAVNAGSGHVLWTRFTGDSRAGPLATGRYVAVVTLTDTLVVLDATTGKVLSRSALGTSSLVPPVLADDSTAVIGSPDGRVIAVTLPSGARRWEVRTENPVYGTPAVARDTVFALTNGCTLWSIPLTAPMSADSASIGCVTVAGPSVVRGGVLVATVRGEVILYDRARRAKVWTRQLGAELRQPPVVRNGQFVVAPTMGQVVSFR